MNACPECDGLLIEDVEDDDYNDRVYGYYCPACGWSSDDEVVSYDEDEDDVFPRHDPEDDFQPCARCDGSPACADFGCAFQMGLGHLVNPDSF